MNRPPPDHPARQADLGRGGLAFAAAVLAVSLLAISRRSFWIDEAATAVQAMQPTLAAWWHLLVQEKSAHLQMPLYMFYIWAYEKLCGSGEWTLRIANLPWFVAGATTFILAFPTGDRRRSIAACVALLCPFAWYYLDEARPYGMELGASLLVVASLARLHRSSPAGEAADAVCVALFLVGIVILSGCTMLGMIWAGTALLATPTLLSWTRIIRLIKQHAAWCLAAGGMLLLFGSYYLWTLAVGARASAAATTTLGSTLFIGYELLGFSGLGSGRLALRSAGPAALRPYLVWLALYAVPTAILIGAALRQLLNPGHRRYLVVALCCCIPSGFLLAVGWVAHFRVLGRHFTPLIPVMLLLFVQGCSVLWSRRNAWAKGVIVLFCALSLVSCLSLRFLPRHEKDDYRAAAAVAKAALRKGQLVWWSAAREGAQYYGVLTASHPGSGGEAIPLMNPTREILIGLPTPQVIIASKPDIYDGPMALAEYIREQGFQPAMTFTAFVIWKKGDARQK